ncbi:TIGR02328 family protein [Treponema socranskii]|uniref:TIGR02328 family protein n=1 Tax=Treponema socranskii TaxID=53419 RepID=UPI0028EA7272|nr:TIGR02328 family protein [Treponema socranskii]
MVLRLYLCDSIRCIAITAQLKLENVHTIGSFLSRLISELPCRQLLGQHRECCALRGNGRGRQHATVNYVFRYSPYLLYRYHRLIMAEMDRRGYRVSPEWLDKDYRGRRCPAYNNLAVIEVPVPIYTEHDDYYYRECLKNLETKGIHLD